MILSRPTAAQSGIPASVAPALQAAATAQARADRLSDRRTDRAGDRQTIRLTGDRLSGVVLPVAPLAGDIELSALRASVWTVDDTKRLVLDEDVTIRIAGHRIRTDRAVVWLNRIPSADGLINQIAVYAREVRSPGRSAGLALAGNRLLVTGSARGTVHLEVADVNRGAPRRDQFLDAAERRLREHLRSIVQTTPRLGRTPRVDEPPSVPPFMPVPGAQLEPQDLDDPVEIELPGASGPQPWLRAPGAKVVFAADWLEIEGNPDGDENVLTAIGSFSFEYLPRGGAEGDLGHLVLSADRAVVFLDPGSLEEMVGWEVDAERVRGVYLEGNVHAMANEGEYSVRSPRVYYDLRTGRALMVDAVLRTHARDVNLPIYARAAELRQVGEREWTGEQVRVTNSEFHTGHIALGAERMRITRELPNEDAAGTEARTWIDARDITLRAGDIPVFYWPVFAGEPPDVPIRGMRVGTRDNDGVHIGTEFDLYALAGKSKPEGLDVGLRTDVWTKRGAGMGLVVEYDLAGAEGALDLFGQYDDGIDKTSPGGEVDSDERWRGIALGEYTQPLGRDWTFQGQLAWISDPTYVSAWREDDFREHREYETSAYLKHQKDRSALTLLGQADVNQFISNDDILASTQYQVQKSPEVAWRVYGLGGGITYGHEMRASRMRMRFQETTPREIGVRGRAFGIGDDDRIDAALRARGLGSSHVLRADSRHELAIPTTIEGVRVVPFLVGRVTAYDDDFEDYSSDSDDLRLYGAAGLRLSKEFQHVDDTVESRLLDLHRMRHIVEPSATLWYGYADVDQEDLPVYDLDVESLATGAAMRFGVRNTWQTQRGGPGRWRSVDVLTVNTDLVFTSGDADRESPTPRFFDYRPEYSQMGDHAYASAVWEISDTLSLVGEGTYDLEESLFARSSIGAELRHTPNLVTFVEYRHLEASDDDLLDANWDYRLTPKYRVVLTPQWDFNENEFRSARFRVVRSFPDFDLSVQVKHDNIQDETTLAASLDVASF